MRNRVPVRVYAAAIDIEEFAGAGAGVADHGRMRVAVVCLMAVHECHGHTGQLHADREP